MKPVPGIWLVGAAGMLGRQLAAEFSGRGWGFFASDREADIRDLQALRAFARGKEIAWIVNCAAYTAVDRAEDDPETAMAVNADGVENLARLSGEIRAALIHFSTDYVFAGDRSVPYREEDAPRPLSRYGWSKWLGETRLAASLEAHFLFRISWLYGVHGANFVKTMLNVFRGRESARVVNDQSGSPTYAAPLAANIAGLIASGCDRYGTYHYCDRGVITWFDFAARIQDLALASGLLEKRIPLLAIATSQFPTRAQRPAHAVLDNRKVVRELGFRIHDWQANLEEFFRELTLPGPGRP